MKISLNTTKGRMLAGPTIPRGMVILGIVNREDGSEGALVEIPATGQYAQLNAGCLRSLPQGDIAIRVRQAMAGQGTSKAKADAVRENGKSGGRPSPIIYASAWDIYWASFDGQQTFQELTDSESPDTKTAFELGEWLRVPASSVPKKLRELAEGYLADKEADEAGRDAQRDAGL